MVVKAGYEAYRRSAESTSRDQTGELQPMTQVGPHAPALFAAQAGSAERADYTLTATLQRRPESTPAIASRPGRC